jgi:hypothetical protein
MLSLKREKVNMDSSGDVVIFLIADLLKTSNYKNICNRTPSK